MATIALVGACGARTGLPMPEPCEPLDLEVPRKIAPLDMHLMLDASGSMADVVTGETTKWQATTAALQTFFATPDATGLGVGLTFFPVVDPAVPEMCGADPGACGAPAACTHVGICLDSETVCDLAVGCAAPGFPDEVCHPLGLCELDPDSVCSLDLGVQCPDGAGSCIDYAYCENHYACGSDAYGTPVVALETLPAVGGSLLEAMQAHMPEGATTTLPALQGAFEQAAARAASSPDRRQVVVLATDGLPTACDPALEGGEMDDVAIQHLVDLSAASAALGVRTFVVGVFTEVEAEEARANLDAIAQAGGAESAFIVGADSGLVGHFAQALEDARIAASTCEYPLPPGAEDVDLQRAVLELDLGSGPEPLTVLGSASACAPGDRGVYRVDVESESRLVLCPSICGLAGGAPIRVVDECIAR